MNHRTSHNGRSALLELAKHSIVCDRAVLLPAVATLTPGIDPIRRHQLWDTVCSQTEILADLDNNYLDAVRTYLGIAKGEPLDADRIRDEAIEDQADAIDKLLNPVPAMVLVSA